MRSIYFFILFQVFNLNSYAGKIFFTEISADDPLLVYEGRFDKTNPKAVRFSWPGVSITASFEGRVCNIKLDDLAPATDWNKNENHNFYNIIIDNKAPFILIGDASKKIYKIDTLKPGTHQITIFKRTEAQVGESVFYGLELEKGKKLLPIISNKKIKIEFIGASTTCGYGNEGLSKDCKFSAETENNYLSYSAITCRNLNAEYMCIAFSGKGLYQNFNQSKINTLPDIYDRTLAGDKNVKWDFNSWNADIVLINLGGNDFMQVNPDSVVWVNKYLDFIKTIRTNYPDANIICSEGPMMNDYWPVGNHALTTINNYLNAIVNDCHEKGDNKVHHISLTKVEGNYGCDWHPGLKTHEKMANELTEFIKNTLKK